MESKYHVQKEPIRITLANPLANHALLAPTAAKLLHHLLELELINLPLQMLMHPTLAEEEQAVELNALPMLSHQCAIPLVNSGNMCLEHHALLADTPIAASME